jgi:hypothetical protein
MFIPREPLAKENIFKKITSYDIFKYYCSGFSKIGEMFKSELREDTNPSCCISNISGDLLYTDFGQGSYRCIDYVMAKYNISYIEALHRINSDFSLGLSTTIPYNVAGGVYIPPTTYGKVHFKEKKPTVIKIKSREWRSVDKDFWYKRYSITSKVLESFNVKPISHFWINDEIFVADTCSYSYDFYWKPDLTIFYRKIYQPYSTKLKWISNGGKVCQGEGMLPKEGDLLIITKSLKDVIVLYLLGFTAIAPVSETSFLPSNYFLKQRERFKKVLLFYDSDSTGLAKAKEFSEQYGIDYRYIPLEYKAKDISDFVEKMGIDEGKKLANSLFLENNSVNKDIILNNDSKEILF